MTRRKLSFKTSKCGAHANVVARAIERFTALGNELLRYTNWILTFSGLIFGHLKTHSTLFVGEKVQSDNLPLVTSSSSSSLIDLELETKLVYDA